MNPYNGKTPIDEPIEIRLISPMGRSRVPGLPTEVDTILTAFVLPTGLIQTALRPATGSTPLSLSNLQAQAPIPGKAVKGWQAEMVDAIATSLYRIVEVR